VGGQGGVGDVGGWVGKVFVRVLLLEAAGGGGCLHLKPSRAACPACAVRTRCAAARRALEAVGLAPEGGGGQYVERAYRLACRLGGGGGDAGGGGSITSGDGGGGGGEAPRLEQQRESDGHWPRGQLGSLPPEAFPINTHGGLLGLGAPWEVPAMHGLAEAVTQLRGEGGARQVPGAGRALVYGNGGVLSASAVAILGRCQPGLAPPATGPGRPASRL
jgi:acetyl-CoA acetyltransferase